MCIHKMIRTHGQAHKQLDFVMHAGGQCGGQEHFSLSEDGYKPKTTSLNQTSFSMHLRGKPASTKPAYAFSTQQRHVSFMRDLRGADSLLQKAIEKVEDGKKLDMAQVTRHAATVRSG